MVRSLRTAALALLSLLGSATLVACAGSAQDPPDSIKSAASIQGDSPLEEERKPLSPEERKFLVQAFAKGDRELDDEILHALNPDEPNTLERDPDLYYHGPRNVAFRVAVGRDRSWPDRYDPPSPKLASKTDIEIIKILIDAGFNVNFRSGQKASMTTPLHTAASHGDVELVKVLIAGRADVNANVWGSPLSRAAMYNHTEAAKVLIAAGTDLSIIGAFGENPLNEAAQGNHIDVAEILLEAGMDVDLTSESYGFFTPLHDAVEHGHPEFVQFLLDAGADPDAENKYKKTPFVLAISSWVYPVTRNEERAGQVGQIDIVAMVLAAGADVNHISGYGYTPLNQAAMVGHAGITETLIEAGANVNLTGESYGFFTPLHNAAEHGHLDVARILVDAGAHVNATNKYGDTPLSLASRGDHTEVVELLGDAGAR